MFTLDLIIALVIMTGAMLALLVYSPSGRAPFRDDMERIGVLMTEGSPRNWTNDTIAVPGFLSDDAFNETKLLAFGDLPLDRQRSLLGVRSYFHIQFSGNASHLCQTCGEAIPATYDNLLVLRRYGVLNGSTVTMEVTLWS